MKNDALNHFKEEMNKRGLFREDYAGRTLRDHLGLPRPSHPASA